MNDELVFYAPDVARCVVRWMLEEIGNRTAKLLDFGTTMKSRLLSRSTDGKVPAIRHGNTVVTEAAAICAYLADAFRCSARTATGRRLRGPYYRWLFFAAGPLEAAASSQAMGHGRKNEVMMS